MLSGRGRGRGRGNTLPAWMTNNNRSNGGVDDDSGGRGGGDRQNQFTSDPINFVREENNNNATANNVGMGRGRGRGRGRGGGVNSNRKSNNDNGPSGSQNNGPEDEALNSLLAKAMQKQQQQQKQQTSSQSHQSSSLQTHNISNNNGNSKATTKSKEEIEEQKLQMQRKIEEEEAKEAAKRLEEEARRLEQLREEEERRQLRALVGDISDDEHDQSMTDGDDNHMKRKQRTEDEEEDDDDDFFEFETEEQKEEKARKLREERRRKLRKLEQDKSSIDVVDRPRNVVGIIQSEMQDTNDHSTTSTKMEVVESQTNNEKSNTQEQNESDDDSFDMFAATDNATPVPTQHSKNAAMSTANIKNKTSATSQQECDDVEGYYKANIGEIITLPKEIGAREDENDSVRFRVLGIIGKGVFSSVIKCVEETIDNGANQQQDNTTSQRVVAMKIIRNNEVMAKAALKEMRILRMLSSSSRTKSNKSKNSKKERGNNDDDEVDKEEQERQERENHNIVRLLEVDSASKSSSGQSFATPPPEFRSHCIFLFEYLPHNLREVLNKFGKNVGINLIAVKSYARQLLCALRHLEKHKVVHSDIKPDNILVSANFSTLKLCDFGSAFFETDHDNDPTPYLVSRFYRPPEVILGLEYDRMVDLWSVGVTLSELYTGSVLFPGNSNNDMLKKFMDTIGPFSFKMVKRHAASYSKMGLEPHFEVGNTGGTYEFRKHDLDKVTGDPIVRIVNVLTAKTEASLSQVLLKASKGSGGVSERVEVLKFANFLNRCLALDPSRRLSIRHALQHDFFMKKKKKEENTT